jgi:peptidoglycan lytic transglycosylase
MRRFITTMLAMMLYVTSLGAAPEPNSSNRKTEASAIPSVNTEKPMAQKHSPRPKAYQVGKASWYGEYFEGKPTASGELFDMYEFTAAHMTLPLGTLLRVTNLRNGRWVVVRVNDRGPVVPGRIIDLSYGAAKMLKFREKGLAPVRLDVVQPETIAYAQPLAGLR